MRKVRAAVLLERLPTIMESITMLEIFMTRCTGMVRRRCLNVREIGWNRRGDSGIMRAGCVLGLIDEL